MQAALTFPPAIALSPRAITSGRALPRVFIPSISAVVFLGCLALTVAFGSQLVSGDGDASRHLVVGEHILRTGSIPTTNLFLSTTPDQPFLAHEWLAEVAGALLYRVVGLAAPVLLHGATIGAAFAILYRHLRARGAPLLLALAVTQFTAFAAQIHWHVRPHVFTWLGLAVFAYVLDGWHAGRLPRRVLWWLPPVMTVWANLHGGFAIGLAVLGAYCATDLLRATTLAGAQHGEATRRLRRLVPIAALCVLATLVNPAGPALLLHLREYLSSSVVLSLTQEFQAPNFSNPAALLFLAFILGLLVALPWSQRRPALHETLILAALAYMAFRSARHIPLFAIAAAPVLASALRSLEWPALALGLPARIAQGISGWVCRRDAVYTRMDARGSAAGWPAAALAALALVAALQSRQENAPLGVRYEPDLQPVGAAAYLSSHELPGNGFNVQRWGGYLLHALRPSGRVFIDGELNVHSEALVGDYVTVANGDPGWEAVLARYDVGWVLVPPGAPLVRHLQATGGWHPVYADSVAVVLVREAPVT